MSDATDATPTDAPVLITGATGFVGARLVPVLARAGLPLRCASRDPERARAAHPAHPWVRLDVADLASCRAAVAGCRAAVYLVHAMGGVGGDYTHREARGAATFAEAAREAGLERIVYLGGVVPRSGPVSRHLESRMLTGQILRSGATPCVELRAGMIIGAGSASFRIVRDLSVRLPVMVRPRWLETRSQPIAIDDVVTAIAFALDAPDLGTGSLDLPGPETLSGSEIIDRVAALRGTRPLSVDVPLLSPRLSGYWINAVTRADRHVASELIEGMLSDLVADDDGLWQLLPEHRRTTFDEAVRRALADEERGVSLPARLVEGLVHLVSRPVGR